MQPQSRAAELWARYNAQQQPQNPEDEGVSGRGGFLTSLISEGGAAGGAALGTAILPGIGTIIGGGLGGLFGRLGENKVRDDEFKLASALGEGALSAATAGIAPAIRGVKAAKAVGGFGDDALKAFGKGFSSAPSKGLLAKTLAKGSDDAAVRSFKFSPSQLTKIQKATGVDAADIARAEKLIGKTPEQIDDIINGLNKEFGARIVDIGDVSKSVLKKNLEAQYKPLLNSVSLADQNLGKLVQAQSDEILKNFDSIKSAPVLNTIKSGFDEGTNWAAKIANPDNANLNGRIGTAIRETLRSSSGDDALKSLGTRLNRLHTFSEAAAKQANLGRGTNLVGLTDVIAGGAGGGVAGVPGAVGAVAAKRALNSPQAISTLSKTLGTASNVASKIPYTGFGTNLAGQLAARVPGQLTQSQSNTMQATPMTSPMNTANNISTSIPQNTQPIDLSSGGITRIPTQPVGVPEPTQDQNPYSRESLIADIQRDPENMAQYVQMYELMQQLYPTGGESGIAFNDLSADSQKRIIGLQNVESDLANLEREMAESGLFQDESQLSATLGGFYDRTIGQATDSKKRAFIDQLRSRGISIIRALGEVGNLSETEQAAAIANLPNVGDNLETAYIKLNSLKERFNTAKENVIELNTAPDVTGVF